MSSDLPGAPEFQKRLRETGEYRTDPSRLPPPVARLLGRFDTWCYLRLVRVIYSGYRAAISGEFDAGCWSAHSLAVLRLVEDCGARIEISGMEHPVKLDRPTVFVGNHMSMLEAFLMPVMLVHMNSFAAVVKKSLIGYPFFGHTMRVTNPITVSRRNPREDLKSVLQQGKKFLESGRSVVIFPQATRSPVFDPAGFNSLGIKLAKSAGVPVTPLALKTDFLGNGRFIKDIGSLDRSKTVHFRFGRPLTVEGSGRDVQAKVIRFIAASLKEWGGIVKEVPSKDGP